MRKVLLTEPLPGLEPEIGRWLWALEEVRLRTLRLVENLEQPALDWEGADGRENAIGSLLYHIALVEMSWLFLDIMEGTDLKRVAGFVLDQVKDGPQGQSQAAG